jgi:hypothetical protein
MAPAEKLLRSRAGEDFAPPREGNYDECKAGFCRHGDYFLSN